MFNLIAGLFSISATLFIWLFMGVKKSLVDWEKEFGHYNWSLFALQLFFGLIPLPLGIWNLVIWFNGA